VKADMKGGYKNRKEKKEGRNLYHQKKLGMYVIKSNKGNAADEGI
jgi:hypothetical protein